MTSKQTKFYSTAIAAALVATAVVPAASAATATAVTGEDGKYTINVTANAGAIVTVYEKGTTTSAGTGTVATDGTSVAVKFTGVAGKEYEYKVKPADGEEGAAVAITMPAVQSTKIAADKVTVSDNSLVGKDTIKVAGLSATAANVITISTGTGEDKKVFTTFTSAKGKTEAVIPLKDKELNDLRDATDTTKGKFNITVKTGDNTESEPTEVTFDLAKVSDVLNVDRTYTVNTATAKDTLTISGVLAKDTVKIYKASDYDTEKKVLKAGAVPVQIQKVSKSGAVTITFKEAFTEAQTGKPTVGEVAAVPGEGVYVTVTSDGEYESAAVKVVPEQVEITSELGSAEASNLLGAKKDTVKVTGVKPGATVSLYAAESVDEEGKLKSGATVVATAKADKNGQAIVKLKAGFTAADVKAGEIAYTVTNVQAFESTEVGTAFVDPEPETYLSGDIELKNLGGTAKDTIEIKGSNLVAGATVSVYAAADVTPGKEAVEGVDGGEGTPATAPSVIDGKKPIATGKVDKNGNAILKIKGGLDAHETKTTGEVTTGGVYISATEKNKAASELQFHDVEPADSSESLKDKITVNNKKDIKADTITVAGGTLKKGDVINLYAAADYTAGTDGAAGTIAADKKPIATVKVSKDGVDAVLKLKTGFTTKDTAAAAGSEEKYYVTLQQVDKAPGAPVEAVVGIEKTSEITVNDFTFTNNIDLKDTVTIDGAILGVKDLIEVYDAAGTTLLAKATAKTASQDLVITLKADVEQGKTVSVKIAKDGEHMIKEAVVATEANTELPEETLAANVLNVNFLTLDDNGAGKDATVTVANAKAGVVYNVYEDAEAKTQIGTAKASKDGILVVKLAKGKTYDGFKDKSVYVKAREFNKLENTTATAVKLEGPKTPSTTVTP